MGLEHTPKLVVWIIFGSCQSCPDLCGMVSVIVDDCHFPDFSFVLESAVSSLEVFESGFHYLRVQAKFVSQSESSQGVGYVVNTRYAERIGIQDNTVSYTVKGCVSEFIITDVVCSVVCLVVDSVGDDFTGKIPDDILIFFCIAVNDQCTVAGKFLCEQPEGMADIIDIFEEVQMVRIHI